MGCSDDEVTFLRSNNFDYESRAKDADIDGDGIIETTEIWYYKNTSILYACFWKKWVVEDGMEDYAYILGIDLGADGYYEIALYDFTRDGKLESIQCFNKGIPIDCDSFFDDLQGRNDNLIQLGAGYHSL